MRRDRVPFPIGPQAEPQIGLRHALLAGVVALLVAAVVFGCGGRAPGDQCALCAPKGYLSCAPPGAEPCPPTTAQLRTCGDLTGYAQISVDCDGRRIDGLRCATKCAWASPIETVLMAPGCVLDPGSVCVMNCSDCQ